MQMVTVLGVALYFCFLKIGLQLFKALQQALKDPEKHWLDAQCIYHKALKRMFKHFPKSCCSGNKNVCCLPIED